MTTLKAAVALVLALAIVSPVGGQEPAGAGRLGVGATTRRFNPPEPYPWREAATRALVTTIWYPAPATAPMSERHVGPPAAPLFSLGRWAEEAAILQGRFPLIALSHGTGGSSQIMGWLARDLASRGYIVVGVNHPGNNALEPYTPEGFMLWWERARDVSAVIDLTLADAAIGPHVDRDRIGAIGFSLGGYTALLLAGARTDPSLFQRFCASAAAEGCADPPEFPSLSSQWAQLLSGSADVQKRVQEAGGSYRDERIRAAFAIAPALGPALITDSLTRVDVPVEIVAGQDDDIVPLTSTRVRSPV